MFERKMPWLIFLLLLTLFACAKNDDSTKVKDGMLPYGFQKNNAPDEEKDFEIVSVLKDGASLEEIYDDIDGQGVSDRLADLVNSNLDEFIAFSKNSNDLLGNHTDLIIKLVDTEVKGIVEWLIDTDPSGKSKMYPYDAVSYDAYDDIDAFYNPDNESTYIDNFYSFLDDLSDNNNEGARTGMKEILRMGGKICQYMIDTKDKDELRDDIQELIDDVEDEDFNEDFIDITKLLGKLLVQADYPMWLDSDGAVLQRDEIDPDSDTNSELGNAVKGVNILVRWVNKMMADEENRELLNTTIRELANLFDPDDAETNKKVIKELIYNIEDHLTVGGKTYESDPRYSQSDDEIESNADLGEGLIEFFPSLIQLFLRSDREASGNVDNDWAEKMYALHQMRKYLKNLQFDPDTEDIEQSLIDLMKYDFKGRDRTDPDSGAYPIHELEHALFGIAAALNIGFEDGGTTGEIDPDAADGRKDHGHGKTVNYLTLNDSLFSIRTHAIVETGSTSFMGLFDMTLFPTDGEHISRSYKPFKRTEMDQKRFYYNQNYGALNFMSGPVAGDVGTPDGGNISSGDNVMNSYSPYDPTGRQETNVAQWINSWVARNCFNGEGPFYYADPDANTVKINGTTYHEYLRPNGKVYALVNTDTDTWEYIYPTDVGDAEDDDTSVVTGYLSPTDKTKGNKTPKKERFNRYKAEWDSDHIIIKYPLLFGTSYISPDNASGNVSTTTISTDEYAGSLHYIETIAENEPKRACASPLEAFYRNYQWFWNEKKIVLPIPLYLSVNLSTLGLGAGTLPLGALFQVIEGNGVMGLADSRKFKGNHVWAKTGKSGLSTIPGDYRIEIAASLSTDALDLGLIGGITEQLVYDTVFGRGNANPSVVGKNGLAIARLAFPRSPKMDRGNGVEDYSLGSLEFEVGDDIWEHRSAFLPLFISLLSAIYDNTIAYPDYTNPDNKTNIKGGGRMVVEALTPLLTPLFYYQKNEGSPPYNCWKPRILGDTLPAYGNYQGDAYLQSTAEMYSTANPLLYWNGNEEENLFFLPPPLKTILNMLVDSDLTQRTKRMDGLLPTLLSKTKVVTSIIKLILCDANDTDELMQALEQITTAMKATKGEMVKIFEGEDKYGPGGSPKKYIYPDWMFVQGVESSKDVYGVYQEFTGARDEDTIFDDLVDTLVGHDAVGKNEGYGLANYPDDKPTLDNENWKDFEDGFDDLVGLLYKDSQYSLVESIITVNESFLGNGYIYSDNQISGLLYSVGKLFTYYDSVNEEWVYQGQDGFNDLYNILAYSLPDIHDVIKDEPTIVDGETTYGTNNYWDLLTISGSLLKNDGIPDFIIDTVTIDAKWDQVFSDLDTFLNKDFISEDKPLWSSTAQLVLDLATVMEDSRDNSQLESVYRKFGFQLN
ncbi:MAG: hypothetical protein KJ737_01925 [Proteobacteria bacterium]|nr:hypothetical protein [Pseudomonadota bacterium]